MRQEIGKRESVFTEDFFLKNTAIRKIDNFFQFHFRFTDFLTVQTLVAPNLLI